MYPYQRTPMGNPYISPIYPYIVGVYGLLSLDPKTLRISWDPPKRRGERPCMTQGSFWISKPAVLRSHDS